MLGGSDPDQCFRYHSPTGVPKVPKLKHACESRGQKIERALIRQKGRWWVLLSQGYRGASRIQKTSSAPLRHSGKEDGYSINAGHRTRLGPV